MYGEMTKLYFFKYGLKKLPKALTEELVFNDDLIFNMATFTMTPIFYRLLNPIIKDKYNLYDKFNSDDFNKFYIECLYTARQDESLEELFFLLGILSSHILDRHLIPYIEGIKDEKQSISTIYNMIDFYYASKNDEIDLSKTNLYKRYKTGFSYYDYIENLIHNPLLKVFDIYSSQSFFKKCYKRKKFFYHFMTNNNFFYKGVYHTYDFIFRNKNKVKAIDYIYNKKMDTNILNLGKQQHMINGIPSNNSLEDVIMEAKLELTAKLQAICDYLLYKKDKTVKKEFNIPDDVDLFK